MCPLSEVRIAGGQIAAPAQPGAAYEAGGICIMAEAPRDEDVAPGAGYPMGSHTRTGKMLDLLLERAGLHRSALLTMLRVRCAPPRGRIKDHEDAIANCDTWTQQEFASYAPGLVVLMGALAMAPIYGKEAGVGRTRGVLASKGDKHPWGARQYIATYHPAAAILADGKAESEVAQMIVKDLRTARSLWLHGVTPF
jgi:uracil-DNA glycosylase family 4